MCYGRHFQENISKKKPAFVPVKRDFGGRSVDRVRRSPLNLTLSARSPIKYLWIVKKKPAFVPVNRDFGGRRWRLGDLNP